MTEKLARVASIDALSHAIVLDAPDALPILMNIANG
jgi:hypothetical protein